jgi:hypothetical protein
VRDYLIAAILLGLIVLVALLLPGPARADPVCAKWETLCGEWSSGYGFCHNPQTSCAKWLEDPTPTPVPSPTPPYWERPSEVSLYGGGPVK